MGLFDDSGAYAGAISGGAPSGLSDQDIAFIKSQEGYSPRAAWDYKQWSGGYGSRAQPGEVFTPQSAHEALVRDATPVSQWLDSNVKVPLTDNQRTALTSAGYNLGTGALDRLLPDINAGNWDRVAGRLQSFNQAGGQVNQGLVNRRALEANLLTGGQMPIDTSTAPQPLGAPDPSQLVLPSERYRNLAEAMTQAGLTRPVHGLGDALLGFSNVLQGNAYGSQYEQQQRDYNKALGNMLAGAGEDQNKMRTALLQSQNPALMAPAAQAVLNKPQATFKQLDQGFGLPPITVKEHPDGSIERVDLDALPLAVQTKIKAGEAVPGPANYPGTRQGAVPAGQASPVTAEQQPKMSISAAMQAGLKGDDFLNVIKQTNPAIAQRVFAIANGDEVPQRGDPKAIALLPLVYQYDPSFNKTDAEARFNYKKSFTDPNKKTGFQAIALNNFLHHGEGLYDLVPNAPNHSYSGMNELSNFVNPTAYNDKIAKMDKIADFLGPESVKVASGAEGGEAERIGSSNSFKSSQGQDRIYSNLAGASEVANGKLSSLLDNWKAVMGNRPIPPEILNPRAREILEKLQTKPKQPSATGPTREDIEAEMRRRGLLQ